MVLGYEEDHERPILAGGREGEGIVENSCFLIDNILTCNIFLVSLASMNSGEEFWRSFTLSFAKELYHQRTLSIGESSAAFVIRLASS